MLTELKFLVLIGALQLTYAVTDLKFPPGFKFGAGTSAYQAEGAWNASDKSESIWDTFTHNRPQMILDGNNADVAADSYNLWRRDVEIAKEMGLDFYRFSLSWTRLLPTGFPNKISEDGKRYYDNLINALLENGIEPIVTIHHFDLPQRLQNLGGWTNPLTADWFAQYARVVFTLYGDRVKRWLTINEPLIYCATGYGLGLLPPEVKDVGFGYYLCAKNSLVAHAKAYRIYDEEFRSRFHGKISFAEMMFWMEPTLPEHEELADLTRDYFMSIFMHPILSEEGGYPPKVEEAVAKLSRKEGFVSSRLPALTDEEKKLIKGTADFMSINYYTSRMVEPLKYGEDAPFPMFGAPDVGARINTNPEWGKSASEWFQIYPEGLRKLMQWLQKRYGDIEILIAENGFSTKGDVISDGDRIESIHRHLEQVLLAIHQDKINVVGYTAWSLYDVFEWIDGFKMNFGLYQVDFNNKNRTRTPRLSSKYYTDVIATRSLRAKDKFNKDKEEL